MNSTTNVAPNQTFEKRTAPSSVLLYAVEEQINANRCLRKHPERSYQNIMQRLHKQSHNKTTTD